MASVCEEAEGRREVKVDKEDSLVDFAVDFAVDVDVGFWLSRRTDRLPAELLAGWSSSGESLNGLQVMVVSGEADWLFFEWNTVEQRERERNGGSRETG